MADDLVDLRAGDQLVADGVVRASASLEADESLLTGESEPVDKRAGDRLLSGSFVVAGSGGYQATGVGADAYARKLAAQARRFALVRSELMDGHQPDSALRHLGDRAGGRAAGRSASWHAHENVRQVATGTVAALVGMVPQGLVLLTSVAFGVAAVTLARRRVLVQQLPAVEGLARVDVVCLDKTGTLTDGTIAFDSLIRLDDQAPAEAALGALADDENRNATLAAVGQAFPPPRGVGAPGRRAVLLGAQVERGQLRRPRHLGAGSAGDGAARRPGGTAVAGRRTWPPAGGGSWCWHAPRARWTASRSRRACGRRPSSCSPSGCDPTPPETIAYFAAQGVALKVISGDSPLTVSAVAARAGLPGADRPVDARDLPEDPGALGRLLEERSVFGRVTPQQKQAMVTALQARGHTVAMTGDGVNDVLALKLADIGIAMGSGAAATRAVAELVLLDSRFATLPGVVAEGRRVTANIERVANLFITKTVWATLLAVAVGVTLLPYPFLPRHLTIIDTLAIGVPVLLPRARAEHPALPARVHRPGAALRHPGRQHHRRGDIRRLRPGPGPWSPAGAAAHGRDPGHPHPQPVRAGPARRPADLAPDRAGRRRAGRLRAAVPGTRGAPLLRTAAAARRARDHAGRRSPRRRRARGLLGPVPPAWPRTAPGGPPVTATSEGHTATAAPDRARGLSLMSTTSVRSTARRVESPSVRLPAVQRAP